jgi:hypothetical protein
VSFTARHTAPPSRKPIGRRLKALSRKPMFASTTSQVVPFEAPTAQTAAAASPPRKGPASETSADR